MVQTDVHTDIETDLFFDILYVCIHPHSPIVQLCLSHS